MAVDDHPSNDQKGYMSHKGLWSIMKFFNLTLVKTIPTPSLGSLSRMGCADDGPSSQVSWPRHHKIRTSIGFRYQNLGWSIDELSHNSKVMQAKAPSMHSITSKQKYHEQVLNIESSRIQWHCCIWSWIELESALLSFLTTSTVDCLEAFSLMAEKLGHQPHCPLQKLSRKPGLWTIRTSMKELHLGCCMQQMSCHLMSFVHFGSQSRSITNTVDRPAETGLEEVEESVALPACQLPGTKQLTKCSDLSAPNTFNATNARRRNTFLILHDSLL